MDSTLAFGSSFCHLSHPNTLKPTTINPLKSASFPTLNSSVHVQSGTCNIGMVKACFEPLLNESKPISHKPFIHQLKTTARAIVFAATAVSLLGKFQQLPARADPLPATTEHVEDTQREKVAEDGAPPSISPEILESNSEGVEDLTALLQEKLQMGEDGESLKILRKLVLTQPENSEWKFLMARLLNEMGEVEEARKAFEEILAINPLSFEALFENALIMDSRGEGKEAIKRLEEALKIAEREEKVKEARDVKLIMAQIQFLQKNVEEALKKYEELEREDPDDFRPYFCKGMIFTLLNKDKEAKEQFAKYRELSPKKFEVEGYLKTPLSRMRLFGNNEEN